MSSAFSYTLTGLTTDACGAHLSTGSMINVVWAVNGESAFDRCFVALRPLNNLIDDGAFIIGERFPSIQSRFSDVAKPAALQGEA